MGFLYKSMRFVPGIVYFLIMFFACVTFFINIDLFFLYVTVLASWTCYVAVRIGICSFLSESVEKYHSQKNWKNEYDQLKTPTSLDYSKIVFYYLLANYKENVSHMMDSIETLAKQEDITPKEQIVVVLCMEERENKHVEKAEKIISKYQNSFVDIYYTAHPRDIEGELPGKGSNLKFGCRSIKKSLKKHGFKEENAVVVCADADSVLHKKFLSNVAMRICVSPKRNKLTFGGPLLMTLNIKQIPALTRVFQLIANNTQYSYMRDTSEHLSQSTFAISYSLCKDVGFWSPDYVAEDYHMFTKCALHMKGDFSNEIIGLPIRGYALETGNYKQTLIDRYYQARRHAKGLSEVVFFLRETLCKKDGMKGLSLYRWAQLLYGLSMQHLIVIVQFLSIIVFTIFNVLKELDNRLPMYFNFNVEEKYMNKTMWKLFVTTQVLGMISIFSIVYCHARLTTRDLKCSSLKKWAKFTYLFVYTFLEFFLLMAFSTTIYGVIPTLIEAYSLFFETKYVYFEAGKGEEEIIGEKEIIEKKKEPILKVGKK